MSSVSRLHIVGAGAAGIGAAREAARRGIDVVILEASNRIGGRALTLEWSGSHLDLGCTWMHSAERNSLRMEAQRIGAAVDANPTNWFGQYRNLGWSTHDQEDARAAFERLETRMREDPPPTDRASDALEPGSKWNAWLNALSGYVNGAPLGEVSIEDWLAYDRASTETNLRVKGGYGSLLQSLGSGFKLRLQTPVSAVRRRRDGVELETPGGLIETDQLIVTVPTATLCRIRFDPPITAALEAAEQLPLGVADKLFLKLSAPEACPNDAHLLGNPFSSATGSYFLRPLGMPVVEAFYGGDGARTLTELADEDAAAFAVDELAALLGSDFRRQVTPLARSRWSCEPWIGGSYSHARPGCASARQVLANAGDERIAFAGEAVSRCDYSTAHGAYDSGAEAVRRLLGVTSTD